MTGFEDRRVFQDLASLCTFKVALTIISHPAEYAKTLMQIGYEPLAPVPGTTLLGAPALYYPNILNYWNHIRSVDGNLGLWRGLYPAICANLVKTVTYETMLDQVEFPKQSPNVNEIEHIEDFLKTLKSMLVVRSVTVIVAHPFHLVMARSMAQFIGGEDTYDGYFFCGFFHIIKNEGLFGLFNGLVPSLIREVFVTFLTNTFTYAIEKYLVKTKEYNDLLLYCLYSLWTLIFYPLAVVETTMMVTNSGLAAGSPPSMPHYDHWILCYADLLKKEQTCRGATFWFRYVNPATINTK